MLTQDIFVSIGGSKNYYGKKPFKIGTPLILRKEPDNPYDQEAIGVFSPFLGKLGYVSNQGPTSVKGTQTASRIYDRIMEECACVVRFITEDAIIAQVYPFKTLDVRFEIGLKDYEDLIFEEDEEDLFDDEFEEDYDESDWEDF
ncbi:MAG: HIRAN domain-containing protein [Tissierellia bacterium]|nr:HIRAN domain-containing protein [Tissierellia bacterium]